MNGLRHNLFPGSRFTRQEHSSVGARHLFHRLDNRLHGRGAIRELRRLIVRSGPISERSQAAAFDGPCRDQPNLVRPAEGFLQVVCCPHLQGLHGRLHGTMRGENNDLHLGHFRPSLPEKGHAIQTRHAQVGDHQIEGLAIEHERRLDSVGGLHHFVALGEEGVGQETADALFVVNHENPGHQMFPLGKRMRITAPPFSWVAAVNEPP